MNPLPTLFACLALGACGQAVADTPDDLPGGPYAAVCRTTSCGGPGTPPLPACEGIAEPDSAGDCAPVPPINVSGGPEAAQVLMLGGIDPDGNVRMIAVDQQGHLKCSPSHTRRKPRSLSHYYVGGFPGSLQFIGTSVQVDRQGRAICSVLPTPPTTEAGR